MEFISNLFKQIRCITKPEVFPGISRKKLLNIGRIRYETPAQMSRLFLFVKQVHGGKGEFAKHLGMDWIHLGTEEYVPAVQSV